MSEPRSSGATSTGGVMADNALDNAVWQSLSTTHGQFAEIVPGARRYRPDIGPFGAADVLDGGGWAALARLAGPGGVVVLFRADIPPLPAGWERLGGGLGHQMLVADLVDPGVDVELRPLGEADAEAMVDLVRLTQPGPFERRTFELGGYVGVFAQPGPGEDGPQLVAMAGERIRFPGHTEISAVCTHPDARGRGLAAAITHHIALRVQARSEVPFLHVAQGNDNARRVYERLGFRTRRMVEALVVRTPGGETDR